LVGFIVFFSALIYLFIYIFENSFNKAATLYLYR